MNPPPTIKGGAEEMEVLSAGEQVDPVYNGSKAWRLPNLSWTSALQPQRLMYSSPLCLLLQKRQQRVIFCSYSCISWFALPFFREKWIKPVMNKSNFEITLLIFTAATCEILSEVCQSNVQRQNKIKYLQLGIPVCRVGAIWSCKKSYFSKNWVSQKAFE